MDFYKQRQKEKISKGLWLGPGYPLMDWQIELIYKICELGRDNNVTR